MKASDTLSLDVTDKSSVTDMMVICTGTSTRHVASIADNLCKESKLAGIPPHAIDGQKEAEWVVVDMGDVIVHIMQEEQRNLYQLEKLWS
ncbi:ribosome silencing factor [Vibrio sp. SS-MA-C1-2]|nr:ribosome silencing factor [Vibrio sp. SS-MA-C1-2]